MNEFTEIKVITSVSEDFKIAGLTIMCDQPLDEEDFLQIIEKYINEISSGKEELDFDFVVTPTV